ncbi:MAG: hypothetical protein MUF45_17005, partial [Spirosomaceae bacterium]|nr:hypothetical protein [Spirosomataceae bacterium]
PRFEVKTKADRKAPIETKEVDVEGFVDVRGWKTNGQKINTDVVEAKLLAPKVVEEAPKLDDTIEEAEGETADIIDGQETAEDSDGQLALF